MKCSGGNEILCWIFHVQLYPLHFMQYCENFDYFLDSVCCAILILILTAAAFQLWKCKIPNMPLIYIYCVSHVFLFQHLTSLFILFFSVIFLSSTKYILNQGCGYRSNPFVTAEFLKNGCGTGYYSRKIITSRCPGTLDPELDTGCDHYLVWTI